MCGNHSHGVDSNCGHNEPGVQNNCCCEDGSFKQDSRFHHHFQTKEEKIAELEKYQGELKKELQAVEEMLSDYQK